MTEPLAEVPVDVPQPPRRRRSTFQGRAVRWAVRTLAWTLPTVVVLFFLAVVVVRSPLARELARQQIEQRLSARTGRPVTVERLELSVLPPGLEIHGLVVPGPAPEDLPVARIETLRLEGALVQLWPPAGVVSQVEVVEPELYVEMRDDGSHNLPRWRPSGTGRQVKIDALMIRGGHLQVNQLRIPLDFSANQVWGRLVGEAPGHLRGQLRAEDMLLALPNQVAYPIDLAVHGQVLPKNLVIDNFDVSSEHLKAEGSGRVLWGRALAELAPGVELGEEARGRVLVELDVDAEGDVSLFSSLGTLDQSFAGPMATQGLFEWLAGTWSYRGQGQSPRLGLFDREARDLVADVSVTRDRLVLAIEDGAHAGGRVSGEVVSAFRAPERPIRVDLELEGLHLNQLLEDQEILVAGLSGQVDGRLEYTSTRGDRRAGNGGGTFTVRPRPGASGLGFSGEVPVTIEDGQVLVRDVVATAGAQRLQADVDYDLIRRRGVYDFRLDSRELGELVVPIESILKAQEAVTWLPASGRGSLTGRMETSPEIAGVLLDLDFQLVDAEASDVRTDAANGSLHLAPGVLEDLEVRLRRGRGTLIVTGGATFEAPGVEGSTQLAFDAEDWPLEDIGEWRSWEVPVDGPVTGLMEMTVTEAGATGWANAAVEPAVAVDRGLLTDLGDPFRDSLAGHPLGRVETEASFDPTEVRFRRLVVDSAAGPIRTVGTWDPETESYDLKIDAEQLSLASAPVDRVLAALLGEDAAARLDGQAMVDAHWRGSVEAPDVEASAYFFGLALNDRPLPANGPAQLRLAWANGKLDLSGGIHRLVSLEGGGPMDDDGYDLDFEVAGDDLPSLLELASGVVLPQLSGRYRGTLEVDDEAGPAGGREGRSRLTLDEVEGRYGDLALRQLEPLVATLRPGQLRLDSVYLREVQGDGEVFLTGDVVPEDTWPLDLRLQASLSSRWLELLSPELAYAGEMELLAKVEGELGAPILDGQGKVALEPFVLPETTQTLDGLEATVLFYPDRVTLAGLTAGLGDGQVEVRGQANLQPAGLVAGAPESYRFNARAEDVRVFYPEGWLLSGDAELWLVSDAGGREIRGTIAPERLRYLEEVEVSLEQVIQGLLEPERLEVVDADEWLTDTRLNIAIESVDALEVNNAVADLSGALDLELTGDLARPVLLGKVDLKPGGALVYADNEYRLERGLLTFTNPYITEPQVDLMARTRLRNYEVILELTGTPERLQAQVSSDPPLPQLDVLALVTGGRTFSTSLRPALPGSSDPGRLDAEAFLASQAASAITERVNTLFGFDKFRVDPLAEGSDNVSTVRFTVGKRLSKDLFVTYSRDPASTDVDILEAEWQLSPRLVLVFTQNGDGSFAVDALWDRRF